MSCDKNCRITPFGEPPTPRAAHVATAVGTMVVIQVCKELAFFLKLICLHRLLSFKHQFSFLCRVELVQLGCLRRISMFLT